MKRILISAIAVGTLVLTGCVVAPARGYYYGPHPHYYRPAAVIVP
jgi:hypothetical protein